MERFNIKDFQINKNYCIEASAGTGKTHNIIEMTNVLVKEGVPLDKILIVTYTEKAAGELKHRIREKLNCDVTNLFICTIHSFCQNMIKEFCVAANKPISLEVIDEEKRLKDFVIGYLMDNEKIKDEINEHIVRENADFDDIVSIFYRFISNYYLDINEEEDPSIVSLQEIRYEVEKMYFDFNKLSFDDFLSNNDKKDYYNTFVSERGLAFKDELRDTYKNYFCFDGRKYQERSFKDDEKEAFSFFKNIKESFNHKSNSISLKIIISKHIKDIYLAWQKEKARLKVQTFNDMIRYVREEINNDGVLKERIKDKFSYAIIDEFQDTNQLQWDIFRGIFLDDDKHNIIVVGDPKQSIYSFQGADVFVYKKAVKDIINKGGIQKSLNTNFRSSENMVKSCNDLFNLKIDKVKWLDGFEDSNYATILDYPNINEKKATFNGKDDFKSIKVAVNVSEDNKYNDIEDYNYAKAAIQEIVRCCKKDEFGFTALQIDDKNSSTGYRNVTFKDFAILTRISKFLYYFERELKNVGIPYVKYKDTRLFSGIECAHWISLFKALDVVDYSGNNRTLFKKALFTKFFGYSLDEIIDPKFDRDDNDEMNLMKKWKELVSLRKWDDLIESILIESKLESNLKNINEIYSLNSFKQIGEIASDYLNDNQSLGDLIDELELLSKDSDKETSLVARGTNFDSVQLMTMHASKGLEFPVVIFAGGYDGNKSTNIYKYHDEDGKLKIDLFENQNYLNEETEELKRLFYVAITRAKYLLILPYPFIRGNNFFKDVISEFINTDSCDKIINDASFKNSTMKMIVKDNINKKENDNIDDKELVELRANEQIEVLKSLSKIARNNKSYKHSYSSLSHPKDEKINDDDSFDIDDTHIYNKEGSNILDSLSSYDKNAKQIDCDYDDSSLPMEFEYGYPIGATAGTAIHEIFELLDYNNYDEDILIKTINHCFNNQMIMLKGEYVDNTKDMVNNVLNADFPIIKGSNKEEGTFKLSELTVSDKLTEAEFVFNLPNQYLKNYLNGFIDLLFRRGEYYSILDWKSDKLNDEDLFSYSSKEDLKNHTDNRYSIQRVLYSYCLIKWLKDFYPSDDEETIFNNHFGGVYYVYVRGCNKNKGNGVYAQTWSSWSDLEKEYNYITKKRIGGSHE
ncbi:MAG: UvrD-helicase domain-containing protein [Bacilli bacterium]|nr:UvrD-helicase domain-containing protein [Bacilli bacterium]